jgi:distribution and morphology protein 10
MGIRGLYNFGLDPRTIPRTRTPGGNVVPIDPQIGRLSAGAELYFSPLNKSGGVSTAIRFTTLPSHTGFPYTMALTMNPLMGNISSSYAVKAGHDVALSSRFDFNIYSYESDVQLGLELWRRKPAEVNSDTMPVEDKEPPSPPQESVLENKITKDLLQQNNTQEVDSVFKARVNQHGKIGVLWEGRIKDLLVSIGADLNLKRRDNIIGSVGLEISYSS